MLEIDEIRKLLTEYKKKRLKTPMTLKLRTELDSIYSRIIQKIEDIGYIDQRKKIF